MPPTPAWVLRLHSLGGRAGLAKGPARWGAGWTGEHAPNLQEGTPQGQPVGHQEGEPRAARFSREGRSLGFHVKTSWFLNACNELNIYENSVLATQAPARPSLQIPIYNV